MGASVLINLELLPLCQSINQSIKLEKFKKLEKK